MEDARTYRKAATLSPLLRRKVDLYTLAASAAGVGMLALAHPAQAEIVYTKANESLDIPNIYPIDLNNDGKPDMQFDFGTAATSGGGTEGITLSRASYAPASNGVAVSVVGEFTDAQALPAGKGIGPSRQFAGGGLIFDRSYDRFSHKGAWAGQWANQGKGLNNRYAGVKFIINGEVHYGWIRISVNTSGENVNTTMTGYAYETIANKPIIAGATKESENVTSESDTAEQRNSASVNAPSRESLAALALGSQGLPLWRKN